IQDVEEGAEHLRIASGHRIDYLGEQRPADDDLAPCLTLATVDGPQRLEPFDARLEHAEPLGVVGYFIERADVAAAVDASSPEVSQRRLQLDKPRPQEALFVGLLARLAG